MSRKNYSTLSLGHSIFISFVINKLDTIRDVGEILTSLSRTGNASTLPLSVAISNGFKSLIRDRRGRSVELGKRNSEFFVVASRAILKDADGKGFPEAHRLVRVATPMNSRVDAMAERDIVRELV